MWGVDDLRKAEEELERLSAHLETVVPTNSDYLRAVLALGHRARTFFRSFRRLADSPDPVGGLPLVRALVEINILLAFLGRNPELHTELWIAEGQRQVVAAVNKRASDAYLLQRWGLPDADTLAVRDELCESVKAAREKALEAAVKGVGEKGALVPSTETMAEPEDVMREAYTLAYRRLSSDVHTGPWSFFKAAFTERVGDLVSYRELAEGEDLLGARTLATTTFASTLALVSGVLGLGIEGEAVEVKRPFMSGLPPPDEGGDKAGT